MSKSYKHEERKWENPRSQTKQEKNSQKTFVTDFKFWKIINPRSQIYLDNDFDPLACHQQKSQDVLVTKRDCNFKLDDILRLNHRVNEFCESEPTLSLKLNFD